ncbi:MAG: hypothetical protein HEP71_33130 [Roseivirga sp.]|nr:hypothetical protein [Roseivirga sp.]
MKKLIAILLITLPYLSSAQSADLDLYRLAVYEIKKTYAFEKYTTDESKGIQVMPQVIPLSHMGEPFYKELLRETGTDYNLDKNWGSIRRNRKLPALSDATHSGLKLFFTPIDKGTFMAELVDSKARDWEKATLTGESFRFLLVHSGDKVIILDSAEMDND